MATSDRRTPRVLRLAPSPKSALGYLAGCLGLVGMGVWLLTVMAVVGWIVIGIFGLLALVFVRQAFDRRPRLVIDERGIVDRTLRCGVIPWEQVESVGIEEIVIPTDAYARYDTGPVVVLKLEDPDYVTSRMPGVLRSLQRLNRRMGLGDAVLSTQGLGVSAEEVRSVIAAWLD